MKIWIIESQKQINWGWPAAVNFILGGAAAGFYILGTWVIGLDDNAYAVLQPVMLHLLPPVMFGLGFACLTVEMGRPMRGHQVFRRIRVSRMSQEALAGVIFIFAAILNWFYPHTALLIIATMAAMGLLISQGTMMYQARAVTAWNVPIISLLFVTSSFATGAGLLMVVLGGFTSEHYTPLIAFICALLNLLIWLLYLNGPRTSAFRKATETLRSLKLRIIILVIGHLLPILVLFSVLLVLPGLQTGEVLTDIVTPMMGLALIIGSAGQKVAIILLAGNQREINLN
jgi:DMSO reductase anchor subunit